MSNWRDRFTVIPAVYVIFRDGDKVLFLKRANTGYFDGNYSLPSGHFEGGESATQAAVRETKEEIDVDVKPDDLQLVHTEHRVAEEGGHERIDLFFEADHWQKTPVNAEPDKCSELKWINVHELPGNMVPVVRQALQLISEGGIYGEMNFS